jgi:hypothetical protein
MSAADTIRSALDGLWWEFPNAWKCDPEYEGVIRAFKAGLAALGALESETVAAEARIRRLEDELAHYKTMVEEQIGLWQCGAKK